MFEILYWRIVSFKGDKPMSDKKFEKSTIEIVDLQGIDIIVTSPGIPLPDDWWEEEDTDE